MKLPKPPLPDRAEGSIVERLRRAREARQWSLNELSVKTRIPLRHLETIEAGRGRELPGGFIGKSFVRQYAEAVGLDGEQSLQEFVAQTGVNLEVEFEERKISPFTPESIKKYQATVWRNVGIAALAAVAVILAITYLLTRPKQPESAAAPAPKPVLPAYMKPEPLADGAVPPTPAGEPRQSPQQPARNAAIAPAGGLPSAPQRPGGYTMPNTTLRETATETTVVPEAQQNGTSESAPTPPSP